MRAVVIPSFGGPEVLTVVDLPMPVAEPGEVLVKVAASTVNPTDLNLRAGTQAALLKGLAPPYIAGMEFSGTVHTLGAGARGFTPGQPVMGIVNTRRARGGSQAEYVAVPAASLVPVPSGHDLIEAATVPMNGLTAYLSLEMLALPRGSSLLVTGGPGALGGYVIQLARHAGLRVVADGKDSDHALLRQLGADLLVPRGPEMSAAVRTLFPSGVDGALDGASLNDVSAALVKEGGSFVSVRRSAVVTDQRVRHHYVGVLDRATDTAALQWLADRWREGVLTTRVARRLPCTAAAEANRLVAGGGMRGRVVLTF